MYFAARKKSSFWKPCWKTRRDTMLLALSFDYHTTRWVRFWHWQEIQWQIKVKYTCTRVHVEEVNRTIWSYSTPDNVVMLLLARSSLGFFSYEVSITMEEDWISSSKMKPDWVVRFISYCVALLKLTSTWTSSRYCRNILYPTICFLKVLFLFSGFPNQRWMP